ncbi:MAG: Fur family transcriptional regulator [Thermodesulfobacteriota bacterium]
MNISGKVIEKRVGDFIKRSKDLGLKVTPQRIAIYKELAKTEEHPSTEMIYNNIKDYYPNISLTTVYRTLETFENMGLISVVNVLYNAARYDANLDPHHHIVCVKCKKIEDVYDESINYSNLKPNLDDYKVLGYSVLFNGFCKNCFSE